MMKKNMATIGQASAVILSLCLLSGCDLFKKKEAGKDEASSAAVAGDDAVLVTIQKNPVVTMSKLKKNWEQLAQANPYLKGMSFDVAPEDFLCKYLDQLSMQETIVKYQLEQSADKKAEFEKNYQDTCKLLKESLLVQDYEKKLYDEIAIDKTEKEKYFNDNKERFIKSQGGVSTIGASFKTDAEATAFLAKVKGNESKLEDLAKADKGATFKNFGLVGKEAAAARGAYPFDVVPKPVKETAMGMKTLPGVEKVKADKAFWVIACLDKKDIEYAKLADVEPQIEGMLKNNKFRDVLDKNIKDLRAKFDVVINYDPIKKGKPEAQKAEAEPTEPTEPAVAA
jgi:peptidylprolyl isomerase